ncbi:asparagine synthase C-terminal domain-containing protein [Brevundimonas abyssalis]|uniref:asparagine synthase C-terminal domain-containing protein n=1 Tax=Brevundimonas abyssalis TaxID=1125965 RepID=UPI0005ED23A8|nr:asparagine synthase C-terminal domain-containing protein [Brevundimonas abyssalis]
MDEAVGGLAGLSGPLAAEVSGGLDSSIVAASLVRHAPEAVCLWLNATGSTPESDERAYARLLGRALGFRPQCVRHATAPLSTDWLTAISGGIRPGLNAIDRPQDLAWGRHMEAAGVTAVMTGRGGDSIFFQAATPDVFTDDWMARGWRALRSPDLLELAAANEVSIWTMIRRARDHRPGPPCPPQREHPILTPLPGPAPAHPWLAGSHGLGPGKAFQLAGVIDSVSHHGATALTRTVDVRNPLCAQPVTEACLALPAPVLTIGGRDRGLARAAFRARLPRQIVDRRSKGEMTRIYGRLVAENLDFLRPWLIEGRLAALGLIDQAAAEIELQPEALVWRGHYAVILTVAAYEGWVRTWEAHLGPAA